MQMSDAARPHRRPSPNTAGTAQPHRCAMAKAGETAAALLTTTTLLLLLLLLLNPLGAAGDDDGSVQDLRYRRRRGFRHRNAPQTPAAPAQPVHPTPPPPPPRCNNSYAPEDSLTASGDDQCVPVPARSPPPPVPPPRRRPLLRCPPCTCPRPRPQPQPQPPRPFTGWPWPVPRPPLPVPGGGSGNTPDNGGAYDCVAPLAPLTTCGPFITGNETETPTPASECCAALAAFLSASSAAAAAGGGDHMLRCLCPVILGDVNKVMPRPVDPVRMMYLPIACGVVLPPQVLYACFTGRPSPVVTSLPQVTDPTIEAPP